MNTERGPAASSVRASRLGAATAMVAWIVGSMLVLFASRGLPWRLRGLVVIGSLLLLIGLLAALKRGRTARRAARD